MALCGQRVRVYGATGDHVLLGEGVVIGYSDGPMVLIEPGPCECGRRVARSAWRASLPIEVVPSDSSATAVDLGVGG